MSGDTLNQIRILPVNFQGVFQAAINALLERESGMTILSPRASCQADQVAVTGEPPGALPDGPPPDVLLIDLDNCPHRQLECLTMLRAKAPAARILALAEACDLTLFRRAIGRGARGVVLKADPAAMLIEAIRQVHRGQLWLKYEIASPLISGPELLPLSASSEAAKVSRLTVREREVLALLCEGLKDQEVADRMGVRPPTVRAHLASIYLKLDIRDRLKLVIFSYRHGLAAGPPPASLNAGNDFEEESTRKEQRAKLYLAHRKLA